MKCAYGKLLLVLALLWLIEGILPREIKNINSEHNSDEEILHDSKEYDSSDSTFADESPESSESQIISSKFCSQQSFIKHGAVPDAKSTKHMNTDSKKPETLEKAQPNEKHWGFMELINYTFSLFFGKIDNKRNESKSEIFQTKPQQNIFMDSKEETNSDSENEQPIGNYLHESNDNVNRPASEANYFEVLQTDDDSIERDEEYDVEYPDDRSDEIMYDRDSSNKQKMSSPFPFKHQTPTSENLLQRQDTEQPQLPELLNETIFENTDKGRKDNANYYKYNVIKTNDNTYEKISSQQPSNEHEYGSENTKISERVGSDLFDMKELRETINTQESGKNINFEKSVEVFENNTPEATTKDAQCLKSQNNEKLNKNNGNSKEMNYETNEHTLKNNNIKCTRAVNPSCSDETKNNVKSQHIKPGSPTKCPTKNSYKTPKYLTPRPNRIQSEINTELYATTSKEPFTSPSGNLPKISTKTPKNKTTCMNNLARANLKCKNKPTYKNSTVTSSSKSDFSMLEPSTRRRFSDDEEESESEENDDFIIDYDEDSERFEEFDYEAFDYGLNVNNFPVTFNEEKVTVTNETEPTSGSFNSILEYIYKNSKSPFFTALKEESNNKHKK